MKIIKNGTIHVGNGEVIKDCDILINDGKIVKIEKNINCEQAEIIDVKNAEILPGFIDPINNTGCQDITFSIKDTDEDTNPVTVTADVKYAFNPNEIMMEEMYKVGITTVGSAPGNKNVIGGKMAAFRTYGTNVKKMMLKEFVGVRGCVSTYVKSEYGPRNLLPKTKMGIFKLLEEVLRNDTEDKEQKEIINKVLNKEIGLFITAENKSEIDALLNMTANYDINLIICGAYQSDRCVKEINEQKASVIMGEQIYLSKNVYNDIDLYKFGEIKGNDNATSFTLVGAYGPAGKIKYLWNAVRFYQAGIDSEDVLQMMTLNPAKMLGIDDLTGSIEVGKLADMVIYSENPIKYYSARPLYTIINGEVVYKEGECK